MIPFVKNKLNKLAMLILDHRASFSFDTSKTGPIHLYLSRGVDPPGHHLHKGSPFCGISAFASIIVYIMGDIDDVRRRGFIVHDPFHLLSSCERKRLEVGPWPKPIFQD